MFAAHEPGVALVLAGVGAQQAVGAEAVEVTGTGARLGRGRRDLLLVDLERREPVEDGVEVGALVAGSR